MASKQEYYRRLMKAKKSNSSTVKRIDHPLARYNQLDQLSCVVCSSVVKSDLLWQTHLQSRQHKEKVTELKSLKKSAPQMSKPSLKPLSSANKQQNTSVTVKSHDSRPNNSSNQMHPPKRQYTDDVTHEVSEENLPKKKAKESSESFVKLKGLPNDFFDDDKMEVEEQQTSSTLPPPSTSGLPSDFFDTPSDDTLNNDSANDSQQKESDSKNSNKKQNPDIPEGFFDDPKTDAKKRKVEYKDPQESAWEDFQKSISKETEVSEAIVEKGDEVMQDDRELFEVNEQVACFQKAEELRLKQEQLRSISLIKKEQCSEELSNVKQEVSAEEDSDDDLDLDELSDWRFRTT